MRPYHPLAQVLGLALALGAGGCDKVQALVSRAAPAASGSAAPGHGAEHGAPTAKAGESGHEDGHGAAADGHDKADEYALPFAWESSAVEPLGRARSFLKEMYVTNGDYTQVAAKLFPTYADKQTPRATVLTCADSRVHTTAFDASPENDDFMIRNIGNLVPNALGSIEYGVEHLETPVLFILGHTGCGAVKAAMGGTSKLEKPIQNELTHIHPPKRNPRANEKDAWAEAVMANVHDQVTASLQHFGRRVQSGKLTVVGAVLDFRNDLGTGAGRIVLLNVNGNRDPARIDAFIDAVTGRPPDVRRGSDDRKPAEKGTTRELIQTLSSLSPAGARPKNAPSDPADRAPLPATHAH